MSEKLCLFCKHFDYERIGMSYSGGGTYTGGFTELEGGMACVKGHYHNGREEVIVIPDDAEEFRTTLLRAETCPDYERPAS